MTAFFIGLDTAIAFLKRWRLLLALIPLIALGIQTYRLKSAKADLLEKQAIISNMEMASEVARQAQITLNAQNAQLSQRIAGDARTRHDQSNAALAAAVSDYAASRGLRKACGSLPRQADLAPMRDNPGAPDSPDADEVLAIPRSDFESLAHDALRGAEARAFLIDLANEGLAVVSYPEPKF